MRRCRGQPPRWSLTLVAYAQVLRLWEALWSAHLTPHFHLYVAAGVLGLHRRAIMEVRMLGSSTQVCCYSK